MALVSILTADASNFNKPHTHTGKVEPFQPGDPKVKLDGKALGILKSGKPYQVRLLLSSAAQLILLIWQLIASFL